MPETEKWDAILTLGAVIAEDVGTRVKQFDDPVADDLYILASAMAWVMLRRSWAGNDSEAMTRWQTDIPDALGRYADRIGLERLPLKKPA